MPVRVAGRSRSVVVNVAEDSLRIAMRSAPAIDTVGCVHMMMATTEQCVKQHRGGGHRCQYGVPHSFRPEILTRTADSGRSAQPGQYRSNREAVPARRTLSQLGCMYDYSVTRNTPRKWNAVRRCFQGRTLSRSIPRTNCDSGSITNFLHAVVSCRQIRSNCPQPDATFQSRWRSSLGLGLLAAKRLPTVANATHALTDVRHIVQTTGKH